MTTENQQGGGGSRMKTEQSELVLGQQAPAKPAKPAQGSRKNQASTALPEIDYEKLAAALAPKMEFFFKRPETTNVEMPVQQMADIALDDGTIATGGATLEAVYQGLNKSYIDELAFMEEMVEVMVHETEDPNAENPVVVGVNGVFKPFFRGVPTTARRKFIDGLIVKSTRVTTPEVLNGAGERTNIIKQHSAHKYSFSILRDPNPKSGEWLKRRMAEAI